MKNKDNLIRVEYPPIRVLKREKNDKEYTYYRVDCRRDGWEGQQQADFADAEEAKDFARDVAKKMREGDGHVSADEVKLMRKLKEKLLPLSVDIEFAVSSFIESYTKQQATKTLFNITGWYLEDKKNGLHKVEGKSLIGIKTTCNALDKCFGDVPIGTIIRNDIEKALIKHWKPASQKDYVGRFRTFFKWAMGKPRTVKPRLRLAAGLRHPWLWGR